MEEYGSIKKQDEVKKAKIRDLVNTITLEKERAACEVIRALSMANYEVDVERVQTSNWDGKVIIKVYEVK